MVELGLKLTLSYLIGSVIGSLVVGYFRGGVDIRTVGSGNAGGTNALRTQGRVFAFWVMVIDVGKGILATAVLPDLDVPGVGLDPEIDRGLVLYGVAFAAIVGHVFPVWFGFRGGKGGATAAGLVLYLAPAVGIGVIGVWKRPASGPPWARSIDASATARILIRDSEPIREGSPPADSHSTTRAGRHRGRPR